MQQLIMKYYGSKTEPKLLVSSIYSTYKLQESKHTHTKGGILFLGARISTVRGGL